MTVAQAIAYAMKNAREGSSFEIPVARRGRVVFLKTSESTWLVAFPEADFCREVPEDQVLDVVMGR